MRIQNRQFPAIICAILILASAIYCSLPAISSACAALPTDKGTAKKSFSVTTAGTYRLWAHVHASSSGHSTLALSIDNGCSMSVGGSKLAAGTFGWMNRNGNISPLSVKLASGKHTLTVAGKDASVGIDRVLLVTDSSCVPIGDGSNCTAAASSSGDSGTPATNASTPQNHKLSMVSKVVYIAGSALIAALAGLVLLRFTTSQGGLFKRLPFFKAQQPQASNTQPQTPSEPVPYVTVSGPVVTGADTAPSGGPTSDKTPHHKRLALFVVLGFGIAGGLVSFIALAAPNVHITIDLSSAATSGQAKIVTNSSAVNGRMVQFGAGAIAHRTTTQTTPLSTNKSPSSTPKKSSGSSTGGSGPTTITSSSCTKPVWNTSDPEGTDSIGNNDVWWVNNDAWSGSHGPQSIFVCNQSSWYATSNQTNNGGAVETYPDTEYDVNGRGNATKTIAQYKAISSTFSESYPSAGSWDAAYDLWLNNWSTEIMIWNQWTGTQLYWPSDKSTTVTLGGVPYWFQNIGGDEYVFFRQKMVTSGSVDILAAFNYLVSKGFVKSTDVPTQLEYGVEICATNGTEKFPMNGLTFTLN